MLLNVKQSHRRTRRSMVNEHESLALRVGESNPVILTRDNLCERVEAFFKREIPESEKANRVDQTALRRGRCPAKMIERAGVTRKEVSSTMRHPLTTLRPNISCSNFEDCSTGRPAFPLAL